MRVTRQNHQLFAGHFARVRDVPRDSSSLFHALAIALNWKDAQKLPGYDAAIGLALREEVVTRERCEAVGIEYETARSPTQYAGTELCVLAAHALDVSIILLQSSYQPVYDTFPSAQSVVVLAHLVHQQHYEPIVLLPALVGLFARDSAHISRVTALPSTCT